MKTDYKFWYIKREDDVHISECAIRFYEGEVTTENERDIVDGQLKPVTRYRRTKKLKQQDMKHFKHKKKKDDVVGGDVIIFDTDDFGVISTDDDLRKFLNKEIKKDKDRYVIEEQTDISGKDRKLKDR